MLFQRLLRLKQKSQKIMTNISNVLYLSGIRANVILPFNRLILISNTYHLKKKKQRTINKLKKFIF